MLKNISFTLCILLLLQASPSQANTPTVGQPQQSHALVAPRSAAQEQFIIQYGISKAWRIVGLLFFGAFGLFFWGITGLDIIGNNFTIQDMSATLSFFFFGLLFMFIALKSFFNISYIICSPTGIRLPAHCASKGFFATLGELFSLSSKTLPEIPYHEIATVVKTTEVEYRSNGNYTYPVYYQVLNIFSKDMNKYQIRVDGIVNSYDLYKLISTFEDNNVKVVM